MKKLMIVAAVAMAAVAANAAKVSWGVASGAVGSFSTDNSAMMYLVWADTAPDFSALDSMESFSEATITSLGGKVVTSTAYTGGVNMLSGQTLRPGNPVTDMAAGPHSFYNMIVADDGKTFAYSQVSTTAILPNDNTADFSKAGSTYEVVPAATPVVPEPTSGLLLLVGVAGLALRRRRA